MIYTLRSGRFFYKDCNNQPYLPVSYGNPRYVLGRGASKKFWFRKNAEFERVHLSAIYNHETRIESFLQSYKKGIDLLDYLIALRRSL